MSLPTTETRSLTTLLLSHSQDRFKSATQSPFLVQAGKGTLPKPVLQKWLAQDRLYAQSYIRFASLLLANILLPSRVSPEHINEQLVDLVIGSITNVRKELKFFEDVAGRYGLQLEAEVVGEGVRRYRGLFFGTGERIEKGELGVLGGLVLLWGTEKCYLEAWRYAASQSSDQSWLEDDLDGGALRKEFIPNWTSEEFVGFVDKVGWFVDEIWRDDSQLLERGTGKTMESDREELEKWMLTLWDNLLIAEQVFWPDVE